MTRRRLFAWLWAVALVLPLLLESYAVLDPAAWDTLSEQVIPVLLQTPAVRFGSLGAYAALVLWLGWHLWFQHAKKGRIHD